VELTARSDGRPSIVPKLPQQPDVTLRAPLAELAERGIEVLTPGNAGWRKMQSRHPIGPLNNISERSACASGRSRGEADRARAAIDVLDFIERFRRRVAILKVFIVALNSPLSIFGRGGRNGFDRSGLASS
jgi:hypothetical protein